jgi:hypothetical protein
VKEGLQFHPVRTMDDVLAVAFARPVEVRAADATPSMVTH